MILEIRAALFNGAKLCITVGCLCIPFFLPPASTTLDLKDKEWEYICRISGLGRMGVAVGNTSGKFQARWFLLHLTGLAYPTVCTKFEEGH